MKPDFHMHVMEPSTEHDTDHVRAFLRNCTVDLRVGVYPSETKGSQPVVINVEVEAALPHHYQDLKEDKLDRVMNYQPIYDFIQHGLSQLGHIPLLETVAEQIIVFCFRDVRIQKVRVRLEKPQALEKASAGIEITRTRRLKP